MSLLKLSGVNQRALAPLFVLSLHALISAIIFLFDENLRENTVFTFCTGILFSWVILSYVLVIFKGPGFLKKRHNWSRDLEGGEGGAACVFLRRAWEGTEEGEKQEQSEQMEETRVDEGKQLEEDKVKPQAKEVKSEGKSPSSFRSIRNKSPGGCSSKQKYSVPEGGGGAKIKSSSDSPAAEMQSLDVSERKEDGTVRKKPTSFSSVTGLPSELIVTQSAEGRLQREVDKPPIFLEPVIESMGKGTLEVKGGEKKELTKVFPSSTPFTLQHGHSLHFCQSCEIFQPLRTKHCKICKRCVRTFDHHCPWFGTCIGEDNRLFFFWFLVGEVALLGFFGARCVLSILEDRKEAEEALSDAFKRNLVLLLTGVFVISVLALTLPLLLFHLLIISKSLTTWEALSRGRISYLRNVHPRKSPFSTGFLENWKIFCCLPPPCPCIPPPSSPPLSKVGILWELKAPHVPSGCAQIYENCC